MMLLDKYIGVAERVRPGAFAAPDWRLQWIADRPHLLSDPDVQYWDFCSDRVIRFVLPYMRLHLGGSTFGIRQPVLDALALMRKKHDGKTWDVNGGYWIEAWILSNGPGADDIFGMDELPEQAMAREFYELLHYDVREMRRDIDWCLDNLLLPCERRSGSTMEFDSKLIAIALGNADLRAWLAGKTTKRVAALLGRLNRLRKYVKDLADLGLDHAGVFRRGVRRLVETFRLRNPVHDLEWESRIYREMSWRHHLRVLADMIPETNL